MSASIINGKTELSIRADTGGALLPLTMNSFPINSNFVYVGEEIYEERGSPEKKKMTELLWPLYRGHVGAYTKERVTREITLSDRDVT